MKYPNNKEIQEKLVEFLNGFTTREEVSNWAYGFLDKFTFGNDNIDEKTWKYLVTISGIDIKDSPNNYLHNIEDIKNWIKMYGD